MRKLTLFTLVLVLLMGASFVAAQDEQPVTEREPGVSITAYNQGTALVQDRRVIVLAAGLNTIDFTDVAALIDPTSVSFTSLTDPDGTVVLEQNYIFDLVNSSGLLTRYLDETIEITTEDGTVFTGQLLSGRNGEIILRESSGQVVVISLSDARNIRFPELPEGLITRPTLRWEIFAETAGEHVIELTYLTGGINWTADYNILLARDNHSLSINGWVTLSNTSGTTFTNAQLKLVAGDVNRAPQPVGRSVDFAQNEASLADTGGGVAQRELFEYQLYEIQRPVTIRDNETKQIEFVTGANIPANTFFVYDSSPAFYNYGYIIEDRYYGQTGITDVQNWLEFSTDEDGGVGADLPAGRVRVYQEDIDGAALLIGENRIDHTPQGESVSIYLGNAFDLVGERTQTNFVIVSRSVIEETYEIHLRNRKDNETVEIRLPEHLFRWSNWRILDSTHTFTQLNSNTIEFRVNVAPDEEVIIRYTVQYAWPR